MTKKEQVSLSDKEMAVVERLAKQLGTTPDQLAGDVIRRELFRRMGKRMPPAKVISLKRS